MPERAKLYNDLAEGPDDGAAWWLTTRDDVRIRAGGWGAGAEKGTILLFNGRSEYIEKYGRTARDFLDRGFATFTFDWRGQGLTKRPLPDRQKGHVEDFIDYQNDVEAVLTHVEGLGFKPPFFLVAHSMGGGIAYRALLNGLPVQAAAFSGPMWGLTFPIGLKHLAKPICAAFEFFGMSKNYVFGGNGDNYPLAAEFEENQLTRDQDMWRYMQRHLTEKPDLGLGAPTFHWLNRAISEMRFIQRTTPRDIPVRCYVASEEKIVAPNAIRQRVANWPGAELIKVANAEHEPFMEIPETRQRLAAEICEFFDHHR